MAPPRLRNGSRGHRVPVGLSTVLRVAESLGPFKDGSVRPGDLTALAGLSHAAWGDGVAVCDALSEGGRTRASLRR
jgi:hypothetical protein